MEVQRSTSPVRHRTPRQWRLDWWATAQIAFGVIWLIEGVLEWQPADFHNFLQLITAMSQGQPAPLGAVISAGQAVVAINPTLANGLLAALETAVGLSLISNTLSRRPVGTVVRPCQPDAAPGAAGKAYRRSYLPVVVPLQPAGTPLPWGSRLFFSRAAVSRHVSIGRGTCRKRIT